jgi:S-DNA-T family DNA segregation ATPase FtsK/SpoIIIE
MDDPEIDVETGEDIAEDITEDAVFEPEPEPEPKLDDEQESEPQAEFSFVSEESAEVSAINEEEAALFNSAVSLVVSEKKASISLLQKNLELGYFKAAKLLNALESRGVIAPYAGSIARKVIISDEEAERIVTDDQP